MSQMSQKEDQLTLLNSKLLLLEPLQYLEEPDPKMAYPKRKSRCENSNLKNTFNYYSMLQLVFILQFYLIKTVVVHTVDNTLQNLQYHYLLFIRYYYKFVCYLYLPL